LEMIEKDEKGIYRRSAGRLMVASEKSSEAIRAYYKSLLPRVEESIETQSPKQKVIGAEVMMLDPSQLEEVRKLTDEYLNSLQKIAAQGRKRTQVYQAFVDVFPLTKKSLNKELS
jgi:uncharacterized protein (TIGR02147 family)